MEEIHLTKKDFKIEWYSGTGAGGQHRNKHQNCCRITHIETGISTVGTAHRERAANQRDAFVELAKRVVKILTPRREFKTSATVIRNYNESRNEVHDKESGLKMPYDIIVGKNNIEPMLEARRDAMLCRMV